mmetsp:Transcript_24725/g.28578  ORF Transcript_24725/g.28578 Transcript_24725/m.28578 type:complete len:99 (-) Transcript_24725:86-382(-)
MNAFTFLQSLAVVLLFTVSFRSHDVNAFGARRAYHSLHHNSMKSSSSISSSQHETERILKKAAEIRRNLAQLEGKTFCWTPLHQEAQQDCESHQESKK